MRSTGANRPPGRRENPEILPDPDDEETPPRPRHPGARRLLLLRAARAGGPAAAVGSHAAGVRADRGAPGAEPDLGAGDDAGLHRGGAGGAEQSGAAADPGDAADGELPADQRGG